MTHLRCSVKPDPSNIGKIAASIREAAKKASRATANEMRMRLRTQETTRDQFEVDQERVGFNVKLSKAIAEGASPWDVKPGLLAKAWKYSKKGIPYRDVPIHEGHNPLRTLVRFRRVSGNSPSGSWIHPGFPGIPEKKFEPNYDFRFPGSPDTSPIQFPPDYDLKFPGVPDGPGTLPHRQQGVVKRVLGMLPDFFKRFWK